MYYFGYQKVGSIFKDSREKWKYKLKEDFKIYGYICMGLQLEDGYFFSFWDLVFYFVIVFLVIRFLKVEYICGQIGLWCLQEVE